MPDTAPSAPATSGEWTTGMPDEDSGRSHAADLLDLIRPWPQWSVLLIVPGDHPAADLFAPHVGELLTLPIGRTTRNIFDPDRRLPFADQTFDLIGCLESVRYIQYEFDLVRECTRILKPGGLLAISDALRPDAPRAGDYMDAFLRLRDPYHHRTYTADEWRGLFLDLDLDITHTEKPDPMEANLHLWAEETACSPDVIQRLHILLAQAPTAVAEWLQPRHSRTTAAVFYVQQIVILGRKKDN